MHGSAFPLISVQTVLTESGRLLKRLLGIFCQGVSHHALLSLFNTEQTNLTLTFTLANYK